MEVYSDFQIKDHYYWSGPCPEFESKEERQAKAPQPQDERFEAPKPTKPTVKPIYRAVTVREKDGSTTHFDIRINPEPVRYNGWMI